MIAHIDADAFFASALQRKRPNLRNKPLLALGAGGGCVIAASYEAKAFGVKTGMTLKDARKLCPHALAVPSDFSEALLASRQIETMLRNFCPVVEQMSVDEWFLDLRMLQGGIPPNIHKWAEELQRDVSMSVALTVSIGIAPSKLLAKMASEYRKPAGVTIIQTPFVAPPCHGEVLSRQKSRKPRTIGGAPQGDTLNIESFLKDRPAPAIPGIGRKREIHAEFYNWQTAWDVAHADEETIVHVCGRPGLTMQQELLGIQVEEVCEDTRPPKSISRCRSFKKTACQSQIFGTLLQHLTYTVLKMRRHNLGCREVMVWLRNGDYKYDARNAKLPQLTNTEEQLLPYVRSCYDRLYARHKAGTQVGLALHNLKPMNTQYSLFEDPIRTDGSEQVQRALDELHNRYGRDSLRRGSALETKSGAIREVVIRDW